MDLGRYWASGGQGQQINETRLLWGIEDEPASVIELWPEHVQPFRLFTECETQWRLVVGMSGVRYQGLDYTALHALMQIYGVNNMSHCLRCIRTLERGALKVFNKG